ncbi:MAG: glutamylcysteine synthetase [Clostridiales bacterium]|nr:glutamylcysteine synthetase [Clostridiales bacterium]
MEKEMVRERLYQKYIEPTKRKRESFIGIEIEFPIVNLDRKPVNFAHVHQVAMGFVQEFGFVPSGIDDEGNMYAAAHEATGDILSFDCSYNNLELSLGRGGDLHTLYQRFRRYYLWLWEAFGVFHYTLTGMGVNPYRLYNHNVPIQNGRYRMLFHHLESYPRYFQKPMYFHRHPDFGTFSSASQVQLDIREKDLLKALRAFSRVEPVKGLLFANSVLLDEDEERLCCRDMFWENSTHGLNPHNIGMFDCDLNSMEDLQAYIESTSLYCVERGEKYINFPPVCIMDYFERPSVLGEYYENGVYKETEVIPDLSDVKYLRTFKFEDLTFRGTIEFRSACCQPAAESMTVAAFHVGLMENLSGLDELMEQDHVIYHHGYTATELRRMLLMRELPGFVDPDALYELAGQVVALAEDGLKRRGLGEEIYLTPLYDRIRARQSPAKRMLLQKEAGVSLKEIILEYGRI